MRDRVQRVLESGPLLSAGVISATLAFHLLYVMPATRHLATALLSEDQLVEDVTFVALLLASVLGGLLALRSRRADRPLMVWGLGETNLHNLPGLWGRSEWLRLLFAGGGLVGGSAGVSALPAPDRRHDRIRVS